MTLFSRGLLTLLSGGAGLVSTNAAMQSLVDPFGPRARGALGMPWWFWACVAAGCFLLAWMLGRSFKGK